MNLMTISGRLGRDAEQRATNAGSQLLSFAVAVDTGYGDRAHTEWFRCTIFGKRAEGRLVEFLKKGQQVVVSGELSLNQYTNNEGEAKASLDLMVDKLDLVGAKAEEQESAPAPQPASNPTPVPQQAPAPQQAPSFDDDVPF